MRTLVAAISSHCHCERACKLWLRRHQLGKCQPPPTCACCLGRLVVHAGTQCHVNVPGCILQVARADECVQVREHDTVGAWADHLGTLQHKVLASIFCKSQLQIDAAHRPCQPEPGVQHDASSSHSGAHKFLSDWWQYVACLSPLHPCHLRCCSLMGLNCISMRL